MSANDVPAIIRRPLVHLGVLVGAALLLGGCTSTDGQTPTVSLQIGDAAVSTNASLGLQALLLLTVLSLVPAILLMTTSFIRIAVVLSFARSALGMPQTPPNQVILGLALFLTGFVMWPVWDAAHKNGIDLYLRGEISLEEAVERSSEPLRAFMFRQAREQDLALFISLAQLPQPRDHRDVPTHVLIPAFMVSELKTAFQMGFTILVPFLVIDLVVASVLMSMGMMMLPPTTISLPFKVLLFVLADGWHLMVRSLVLSFQ